MRRIADSMIVGLIALRVLRGSTVRRVTESVVLALFALSMLAGCSTQRAKTVETEKTVQYAAERDPARSEPVVTEKRVSKTEETKSEGESGGLLSGAVNVVGKAIALPFRVVAGLVDLAF